MPKTIAITPSWYWPAGIPRVVGIPPFSIYELCVVRHDRDRPDAIALIDDQGQLPFGDLRREVERRAGPLAAAAGERRRALVSGRPTRENLLQLLAGMAAGVGMRVATPHADVRALAGAEGTVVAGQQPLAEPVAVPYSEGLDPTLPAVTIDGATSPVMHSNRSLLAMALAMATFLDADGGRPWLSLLPLSSWEGLTAAVLPLYLGSPLVLPPERDDPDSLLAPITRTNAGYVFAGLEDFAHACREAKRSAKDARRVLNAAVLSVEGPFDPDQRRRVSKSLECPALTVWGMPETGPVFASHQSWYMDESVGLPMTNAHVVPSDPRTGAPIQALWELVESAEVTVFSPSLMTGYEDAGASAPFTERRFRTGMMASSDANGMIYLLGS